MDSPIADALDTLRLTATARRVLVQMLHHDDGRPTPAQLAAESDLDHGLVSRALRQLEDRGVVARSGRGGPVTLASDVGAALRAEAELVVEGARLRAEGMCRLADELQQRAPQGVVSDARSAYWFVPLSADGPDREQEVRAVAGRFDACVPPNGRARGVPRRLRPGQQVTWRVLLSPRASLPDYVSRSVRREVRRSRRELPWLEVLDGEVCGVRPIISGLQRTVWVRRPEDAALGAAAFERWWDEAQPEVW